MDVLKYIFTNKILILIVPTLLAIGYNLKPNLIQICEIHKCPYCYGTDLCNAFQSSEISLNYLSLTDAFNNIFGSKNVFFGTWKNKKIVLKKLGTEVELKNMDNVDLSDSCRLNDAVIKRNPAVDTEKSFLLCNKQTLNTLLSYIKRNNLDIKQFLLLKNINIEPIILNIFKNEDGWPVPKIYGACGRLIVEKFCGQTLTHLINLSWNKRVYLSMKILHMAYKFTMDHETFRIYLTDISSDNIAVDADLNVYFVDLEHVILIQNEYNNSFLTHRSLHFPNEDYAFSSEEICASSLSDHNIYSVCRLILSPEAQTPMIGGLLHSLPKLKETSKLIELINLCVEPSSDYDRFQIYKDLIELMQEIVHKFK